MKIIKSLIVVIVCLCTTTVLHAQEIKSEIAKPADVKPPQSTTRNSAAPSPSPELKPQPQVAAVATQAPVAAETPSPLTRKENVNQEEKEKLEAKTYDAGSITTPGGEAGRKIMAGNTTRPADPIYSPSTVDPKKAPQPVKPVKPANGQQQQQ